MKIEKQVEKIAAEIRKATLNIRSEEKRFEAVSRVMAKYDVSYNYVGEKQMGAAGAVGSIQKMKGRYRINYRCGYGKHNYAPCVEIYEA